MGIRTKFTKRMSPHSRRVTRLNRTRLKPTRRAGKRRK